MINMYYHGGSANHGCEAIVRSTQQIIDQDLTLFSTDPDSDRTYFLDATINLIEDPYKLLKRGSLRWLLAAGYHKLKHTDYLFVRFARDTFFSKINKGDIYLSIGGDNYCYAGNANLGYYNRAIQKKGGKTVLWGCSFEQDDLTPAISEDLARYNLITARESISYTTLKHVNQNTVLVADPAFILERMDLPLPTGWIEGNMIGINASPLILQCAQDTTIALDAYRCLIQEIIANTDCGIALIPHVVSPQNDDRVPLKLLYDEFCDSGRIIMIDDCNCMELKGYIARCRFFVGARTHATIAAYSSMVPTLVLGYSVKSRGIARDLFGTEENYVLPVQKMTHPGELVSAFKGLLEREDAIRRHLQLNIPAYCQRALDGGKAIGGLR